MNFFLTYVECGIIIGFVSLIFILVFLDPLIKFWNCVRRFTAAIIKWFGNFAATVTKRFMEIVSKYRWLIVLIGIGVVVVYPFIFLLSGDIYSFITGRECWQLYIFGFSSLEAFMTPWIAIWGGIGAAVGIWQMQKRVTVMEKQQENQQKQLRETRFTASVELLGNEKSSARIGGAYSLFYLAQDQADLRPTICEILCAHVRNTTRDDKYKTDHETEPSNEIQTVLDLLFKKKDEKGFLIFDEYTKNLRKTFLCGAHLQYANLQDADLYNANLQAVDLYNANLQGADLSDANLQGAKLWRANLQGANLDDANLQVANLYTVNLQGANLSDANLQGAKLDGANLQGAWLNIANLQGADLSDANLQDAYLFNTNLQGANLFCANLQGAKLNGANFRGVQSDIYFDWVVAIKSGASLETDLSGVIFHDDKGNELDLTEDQKKEWLRERGANVDDLTGDEVKKLAKDLGLIEEDAKPPTDE